MNKTLLHKRLIIISFFICLSFTIYSIIDNVSNKNSVLVNATPITNKVIVIDAGHRTS